MLQQEIDNFTQSARAFEKTFKCQIAFHDYTGEIRGVVNGLPFLHINSFCPIAKHKGSDVNDMCSRFDRNMVEARLAEKMEPLFKYCHCEVLELVAPVIARGKLAGVMFVGPFRVESGAPMPPETLRSTKFFSGLKSLEKARNALSSADLELADRIKKLAALLAFRLASLIEMRKEEFPQESGRKERIRRYIDREFKHGVSLGGLAEYLCLSESRVTQLLREYFQKGFPQLLAEKRIDYAKSLLTNSFFSVTVVSRQSGFADPNYFFRIFKKQTAMSPGEYRKKHSNLNQNM